MLPVIEDLRQEYTVVVFCMARALVQVVLTILMVALVTE